MIKSMSVLKREIDRFKLFFINPILPFPYQHLCCFGNIDAFNIINELYWDSVEYELEFDGHEK